MSSFPLISHVFSVTRHFVTSGKAASDAIRPPHSPTTVYRSKARQGILILEPEIPQRPQPLPESTNILIRKEITIMLPNYKI